MFNTIFGKTLKTVNPFISGMSDFRENYLKAREVVAEELKRKYNLIESYSDNDRLTLDSTNYSIHLTFYIPDGKDLFVTNKGDLPSSDNSFLAHVFKLTKDNMEEAQILLNTVFNSLHGVAEDEINSKDILVKSYLLEIDFFNQRFPQYFT